MILNVQQKYKLVKNLLLLCIALCYSVNFSYGQQFIKVKKGEYKVIKTGFKDAWDAIKTGDRYYQEDPPMYYKARTSYKRAQRYNPNNAALNYKLGVCYLFTDNKYEAVKYLLKANNIKENVTYDIHYLLGRAYHYAHDFDKAILEYTEYKNNLKPKHVVTESKRIEKLITECRNGMELTQEPVRVVISNLGNEINSIYDEYYPILDKEEKVMYYTSRRTVTEGSGKRNPFDNKYYEDIYYTNFKNGKWQRVVRFTTAVNKKKNVNNSAAVALSNGGERLYLYRGKKGNGDIFYSDFKEGQWRKAKRISGKINTRYREIAVCFSSDYKTMYLVSTNPKNSEGGADIFYSKKDANGEWTKPENIGNMINTEGNEISVCLSVNDSILYFCSNGHNTIGGYDIFQTHKTETGVWSNPENIGYPINTADDDLFYAPSPTGKHAYYSANREGGIGGKDIYKIIYLGSEKELLLSTEDELFAGFLEPYDDIFFKPPPKLELDTSVIMRGTITDSEDGTPLIAKIELIDTDISQVAATGISDATGSYKIQLPGVKTYGIEIVAKGYLLYLDVVDVKTAAFDDIILRNFELEKVEVGAKVILKNIFFEFGKSTLKPESYDELDNVIKLLENNETLRIEISGHTDNVGSHSSNQRLSEARAKAVVDYLVKKDISKSRLEYKGYAFDQPIAPNNTEEGRAQNRRVEFKILSK